MNEKEWVVLAILSPLLGAIACQWFTSPVFRWRAALFSSGASFVALFAMVLATSNGFGTALASRGFFFEASQINLGIGLAMGIGFFILQLTAFTGAPNERNTGARLTLQSLSLVCLFARDLRLVFFAWTLVPLPIAWATAFDSNAKGRGLYFLYQTIALTFVAAAALYLVWVPREGAALFDLPHLLSAAAQPRSELWIFCALLTFAVFLRQGLFPFQSGFFALVDSTPLDLVAALLVGQSGMVLFFRVVVPFLPWVPREFSTVLVSFGCVGIFYVALLGIKRVQPRPLFSIIAISDASLVLMGLAVGGELAHLGLEINWITSILATAGLGSLLALTERRIGQFDARSAGGIAKSLPVLSSFILGFLLVAIHFPVSLGFLGEEMLAQTFFSHSPFLGLGTLAASLLIAICAIRVYFSYFLGPPKISISVPDLGRRERLGFFILMALLIGLGLLPGRALRQMSEDPKVSAAPDFLDAKVVTQKSAPPGK